MFCPLIIITSIPNLDWKSVARLRNKLFRWKPRKHLAITSFILEIISSSMQRFHRYSARLPPSSILDNNEFTQSAKHEISADIFIKRKSFIVADEDKKKNTKLSLPPFFELPSLKHRSRCKNIFFPSNSMDALQIPQRQLLRLLPRGLSFCFVANDDDVPLLGSLLPEKFKSHRFPRRLKLIYHDVV